MELIRPSTVRRALEAYAETPHAIPLAGGTDFMVAWNAGRLNGKTILDLSALKKWREIRVLEHGVRIGSLVSHAQIQESAALAKSFPLLIQACATVGGIQIQNRGTLGGNIANASPAGDTFPALAVYEAMVHCTCAGSRRKLPFLEVFTGVKKTALSSSELIEAIEIPRLSKPPSRRIFRKVGTRAAQAISKTVAAGLLWLGPGKKVRELRFALGSMAKTVRRLKTAEAFVAGKALSQEVARRACELLAQDVSPIDDLRSTREYRLQVSKNILYSFLYP